MGAPESKVMTERPPTPVTYFRRGKHSAPGTLDKSRDRLAQTGGMVRGGLARHSRQALAITALAGVSAFGLISGAANASDNDPAPADAAKAITSAASFDALAERQAVADDASRYQRSAPTATNHHDQARHHPAQEADRDQAEAGDRQDRAEARSRPPARLADPDAGRRGHLVLRPSLGHAARRHRLRPARGAPRSSPSAPAPSSAAGWVFTGYGISVVVDHGNGYLTHYAHMKPRPRWQEGQQVKAGDVLGYEGSTGDSTGPHLHFEVHQGMWNQINPDGWLADRGIQTSC